jgi:hypothetical protein
VGPGLPREARSGPTKAYVIIGCGSKQLCDIKEKGPVRPHNIAIDGARRAMGPFLSAKLTSGWTSLLLSLCFMVFIGGPAGSQTCEECTELKQKKAALQKSITDERGKINEAQEKRDSKEVVEISKRIVTINKDLNEIVRQMAAQDRACESACRPEAVQRSKCRQLMLKIDEMESQETSDQGHTAKIDQMYGELQKCNKELVQMER